MRRSLLSALVVALFVSGLVLGQASFGHLHGVIRDSAGNLLPGVEVTISSGTSFRRVTLTSEKGEFWFRDLGPGTYAVTARLAGFASSNASAVIAGGFTRELSLVLNAGAQRDIATVSGANPKTEAIQRGAIGGVAGGIVAGTLAPSRAPWYAREFETETYDKIDDNRWTEVSRKPLSTFSTDVDTASYANVRRFLNHGQMPPKDAVRIEELINYFSYEYSEPPVDKPFAVTTTVGDCPWNSHHRLLQEQDFNDDKKDAGDIGAGHSVTALYELVPVGEKIDVAGIDPLKYQQPGGLSADARREETMTVKLRYKEPDGLTSSLISIAVPSRTETTPALGFAAAVAEFGMVLRGSEFKGSSSYADAIGLATKFKGADEHGHRAEFVRLIGAADTVSRLQAADGSGR